MATPNPHHPAPRIPLSWDTPWRNGAAGGLTHSKDLARRHLLDAMQDAPEDETDPTGPAPAA